MQFVFIAAENSQRGYGHFRGTQIKLGLLNTGVDDVLDAGYAEKFFIKMLEVRNA